MSIIASEFHDEQPSTSIQNRKDPFFFFKKENDAQYSGAGYHPDSLELVSV